MPPLIANRHIPKVVCYHQTHYNRNGDFVSVLPLLTEAKEEIQITHLIIAAIHLNEGPGNITLNDDPPNAAKFDRLWEEVAVFQDCGVCCLGMLGGAAQGSFQRLDRSDIEFEAYYQPLREMIQRYSLDGLDLDVEEEMTLNGIIRLIDRLKSDFGAEFIITLAPVATALQDGRGHLSGFDYQALEVMRGGAIAWYNTQFYNNWGRLESFLDFDAILRAGWKREKVVVGVLTNPGNGHGFIQIEQLQMTLAALTQFYPGFGGVMGWEYFNSAPGNEALSDDDSPIPRLRPHPLILNPGVRYAIVYVGRRSAGDPQMPRTHHQSRQSMAIILTGSPGAISSAIPCLPLVSRRISIFSVAHTTGRRLRTSAIWALAQVSKAGDLAS